MPTKMMKLMFLVLAFDAAKKAPSLAYARAIGWCVGMAQAVSDISDAEFRAAFEEFERSQEP